MGCELAVKRLARGTGGSVPVDQCQVCLSTELESVIMLGYLPPVNAMPAIGDRPIEQPAYPVELLRCRRCQLVQLGLVVDPEILFSPTYPYTSGTTRLLRENFAELYREVSALYPLNAHDLVVDVGSNDGTLIENFHRAGHRVLGIEPTNAGELARSKGIPTLTSFFDRAAVRTVIADRGPARIVTAANVFAHIEDVHEVVDCVCTLLGDDGLFITESHYLLPLLEGLQFDAIYHEHLRYYSLTSLRYLLEMHGLEVVHARPIPSHGGSIRVYAARRGRLPVGDSVVTMLAEEANVMQRQLAGFRRGVVLAKLGLLALLHGIKAHGNRIYGVGAPSRASTLVNYLGLDDGILDCVLEIRGSQKIGKYMPGTLIPVLDEGKLYEDQPEFALLLSWHLEKELIPKLARNGFRGAFIVPLPEPRIESFVGTSEAATNR